VVAYHAEQGDLTDGEKALLDLLQKEAPPRAQDNRITRNPKESQAVKKAIAIKLIKSKTARKVAIKALQNERVRKVAVDVAKRRMLGR
jgi:hypothetical protein